MDWRYESLPMIRHACGQWRRLNTGSWRSDVFINAGDRASPSYYTYNVRLDHNGVELVFRLPLKIIDALNYFCLYKISSSMRIEPALIGMVFRRSGGVGWENNIMMDRVIFYFFPTGEIYSISKMWAQAKKG